MDLINKLFEDIELEKNEYKRELEISLNEVNRVLEKNKFIVEEYAVTSGTSIKYTGNDLMEAYRQYNEWNRENKNIIYGQIEKGIFMDIEMVINIKVVKKIK
ncbi:hypothetical protein [Clostridium sporogenes]|uniref:hypothetical protein n=1 Tax=Clostridium sporogenes TaxID=1509 RepID=UPI00071768FC|nr:hypothetical protein [Clostridium sporogenes]KRU40015.1 hypothetical protein VT94_24920 [Clostridium sporogenes]MBY7065168.1 hypothetical protein [Clostridium sporogenes]MBY7071862.1 hypothetical protein [Clostridium sporogenes]MCW6064762.1 hypothetical protein [Clostridium sporogenes]OQP88511.1 hypothetical protein VT93_0201550 [Clostridium sporogenes]